MSLAAPLPAAPSRPDLLWLFRPTKTELDVASRPSDGLVVFSVMWGMAMMFSAASHMALLSGRSGVLLAVVTWGALIAAGLLVMRPRRTVLLALLATLMIVQYLLRLPVSSNNQTIAFFMNAGILAALGAQVLQNRTSQGRRDAIYEQVRVISRALLAIMYFYGVFHKINTGFLDPATSCATALYEPLTRPFGLDNWLAGIYGAIVATFVVETIALVCLYWRRFFWVGLLISLPFHYVIPISGFSWYMDFSSLVFALYMLSVPREVSSGLYSTGVALVRRAPRLRAGTSAGIALVTALIVAALIVVAIGNFFPSRGEQLMWHSAWLLVWAVFGGTAMVLITRAALLEEPYQTPVTYTRQPWWVYAIPSALFISCMSPYLGLKTESSIAMFSNLHTEGGVSNHLIFPRPPYLFDYQSRAVRVIDSSAPGLRELAKDGNFGLVEHDLALRLIGNPQLWVTYELNGTRYERVTNATFTGRRPSWVERKLLDFKPIDWARPKVCTH
jgi:hypothetical protein